MRRLILVVALAACTPAPTASNAPSAPEPSSTVAVAPTGAATAAPATVAPTDVPTPAPTDTPTPAPTIARTAAPTPVARGPIHNEGQKIYATFDTPLTWFFGEAGGSLATQIQNYRLNGTSLAGSSFQCTKIVSLGGTNACASIVIVPSIRLLNGTSYELTLGNQPLGSFVVTGLVAATPHVVSMKATQFTLSVTFDRPMLHAGECGVQTWSMSTPGTMEFIRGIGTFPAPVGAYTSPDAGYRDFLTAFVSQADISADCRTVTFGSGWGGPTGDIDVGVSGVEDMDGNVVVPVTMTVSVAPDAALPKLMFVDLEHQDSQHKVIRVAYSEAMDEEYVTDGERYYLNGVLVPASTTIECEVANCAWVRLTFPAVVFTYGAQNTLTIIGVRDTAGRAMDPDIVTSHAFQVF